MEFTDIVSQRYSVRTFTGKEVPREVIDRILQETATAPSSKNSKSSAFMVVEDPDTLSAISEMRESGSSLIKGAATAIVVLGDESKTDLWRENCSISATFIQLSAVDKGLGSCWVHVFGRSRSKFSSDPDPLVRAGHPEGNAEDYLRELLGVKDGFRIHCVIALGYEA